MDKQQIRERLLAIRRELVTLQDIADKDGSNPFSILLDLQQVIGEIDSLFLVQLPRGD